MTSVAHGSRPVNLAESYEFCQDVARKQAKNFYYSFLLLDPERRKAMCAIYAFMRYCDDLSDAEGVEDRAASIARWRDDLERALGGGTGDAPPAHPLWPAFTDTVARFRIPHQYFFDMIEGVSSDLEPRRMRTFAELYDYCYHVASVVGLTIVHIFGYESERALELAEKCGIAFQLTNVLRDVKEDAENGRVYLPEEDLDKFGVKPEELKGPGISPKLRELLKFEAARASEHYRASQPLTAMVSPQSQASLRALIGIYSRLLERIVAADYDVLSTRIRVPTPEKLWILARSRLR